MTDSPAFFAASVGVLRLQDPSALRCAVQHRALLAEIVTYVSQGHAPDAVAALERLPMGPERDAVATDVVLSIAAGSMWAADMTTVAVLQDRVRKFLAIVRSRGLMNAPRAVLA